MGTKTALITCRARTALSGLALFYSLRKQVEEPIEHVIGTWRAIDIPDSHRDDTTHIAATGTIARHNQPDRAIIAGQGLIVLIPGDKDILCSRRRDRSLLSLRSPRSHPPLLGVPHYLNAGITSPAKSSSDRRRSTSGRRPKKPTRLFRYRMSSSSRSAAIRSMQVAGLPMIATSR